MNNRREAASNKYVRKFRQRVKKEQSYKKNSSFEVNWSSNKRFFFPESFHSTEAGTIFLDKFFKTQQNSQNIKDILNLKFKITKRKAQPDNLTAVIIETNAAEFFGTSSYGQKKICVITPSQGFCDKKEGRTIRTKINLGIRNTCNTLNKDENTKYFYVPVAKIEFKSENFNGLLKIENSAISKRITAKDYRKFCSERQFSNTISKLKKRTSSIDGLTIHISAATNFKLQQINKRHRTRRYQTQPCCNVCVQQKTATKRTIENRFRESSPIKNRYLNDFCNEHEVLYHHKTVMGKMFLRLGFIKDYLKNTNIELPKIVDNHKLSSLPKLLTDQDIINIKEATNRFNKVDGSLKVLTWLIKDLKISIHNDIIKETLEFIFLTINAIHNNQLTIDNNKVKIFLKKSLAAQESFSKDEHKEIPEFQEAFGIYLMSLETYNDEAISEFFLDLERANIDKKIKLMFKMATLHALGIERKDITSKNVIMTYEITIKFIYLIQKLDPYCESHLSCRAHVMQFIAKANVDHNLFVQLLNHKELNEFNHNQWMDYIRKACQDLAKKVTTINTSTLFHMQAQDETTPANVCKNVISK